MKTSNPTPLDIIATAAHDHLTLLELRLDTLTFIGEDATELQNTIDTLREALSEYYNPDQPHDKELPTT